MWVCARIGFGRGSRYGDGRVGFRYVSVGYMRTPQKVVGNQNVHS